MQPPQSAIFFTEYGQGLCNDQRIFIGQHILGIEPGGIGTQGSNPDPPVRILAEPGRIITDPHTIHFHVHRHIFQVIRHDNTRQAKPGDRIQGRSGPVHIPFGYQFRGGKLRSAPQVGCDIVRERFPGDGRFKGRPVLQMEQRNGVFPGGRKAEEGIADSFRRKPG